MAKIKREFSVEEIEKAAKTIEFLAGELRQLHQKMLENGILELTFFGDSLPHGIEFVERFYRNAETAYTKERISGNLKRELSDKEPKNAEKTEGVLGEYDPSKIVKQVLDITSNAIKAQINASKPNKNPAKKTNPKPKSQS